MASPTVQKVGLETNGPLEGKRLCGMRAPSTLFLPVVQADVCLGRELSANAQYVRQCSGWHYGHYIQHSATCTHADDYAFEYALILPICH